MTTAAARPRFESSTLNRLVAVGFAAAAAAAAVGSLIGLAMYSTAMASASEYDQWATLGAFIVGLFAGVVTGGATYVAGIVVGVRKVMPAGVRLRAGLALTLLPPAVVVSNLSILSLVSGG